MLAFLRIFNLKVQLGLFIVCVVLGVTLSILPEWGFAWSWIFILIALFLLIKYIIVGTVNGAAMRLQFQDFEGAERILNYTKKPEWLKFGMHAMYHFMKSVFAMQKEDFNTAEVHLKKSLELGLPDADNNALAYINLAGICIRKKRMKEAKEYVQAAKKLRPTNPQILENLKQMEMAVKNPIGMRQQQMMHQNKKGGRYRNIK